MNVISYFIKYKHGWTQINIIGILRRSLNGLGFGLSSFKAIVEFT